MKIDALLRSGLSVVLAILSVVSAYADYKEGYYNALEGKMQSELKAAVKSAVSSHLRLEYSDLPNYWVVTDVYPELVDGKKRWWDMYSNNVYLIESGLTGKQSFSANRMQREHSVPKSWWKDSGGSVEYTGAYSDLWNLYPSDPDANGAKSNHPFGICASSPSFDNGCSKIGRPAAGYGGGAGSVFEPADEYKGDFARAIFYMASVYDDIEWNSASGNNTMFVKEAWPTLKSWAVEMLLDWARRDPVSAKEIARNDAVETQQENRNPFIDFPELAEYIWGSRVNDVFYIADQKKPGEELGARIISPASGSVVEFAKTALGGSRSKSVAVKGIGLEGTIAITIEGDDASAFVPSVTTLDAAEVCTTTGASISFKFSPTRAGVNSARLTLSGGGLEKSVSVNLSAECVDIGVLKSVKALPATEVTLTSYVANWTAADREVDGYILTRRQHFPAGIVEQEIECTTTSVRIIDKNADVAESYCVRTRYLGLESAESNTININLTSASPSMRADEDLRVSVVPGGILIEKTGAARVVDIFSGDGALAGRVEASAGQTQVALPSGIYIVRVAKTGKSFKVLVR